MADGEFTLNLIRTAAVGIFFFVSCWRRFGDVREVDAASEETQKFLEAKFQRGLDGRKVLVGVNTHVRFAISLIAGLSGAVIAVLLSEWI